MKKQTKLSKLLLSIMTHSWWELIVTNGNSDGMGTESLAILHKQEHR